MQVLIATHFYNILDRLLSVGKTVRIQSSGLRGVCHLPFSFWSRTEEGAVKGMREEPGCVAPAMKLPRSTPQLLGTELVPWGLSGRRTVGILVETSRGLYAEIL
jgi:hypothetical protein